MAGHKIIMVRGIQGSGKSTWAKEWCKEKPLERVRWNNDDFRKMLGKYWVPEREEFVAFMRGQFFQRAMVRGYDIVVDNMNLNPREEKYFKDVIDRFNRNMGAFFKIKYTLEFKDFFDASVEECIERDSKRMGDDFIGEKVIRETYNRYKSRIEELKNESNSNK